MSKKGAPSGDNDVIRLKPHEYMHVLDNNKNVSRVVLGPQTFTRQEHEQIIQMPQDCISIPPMYYCIIENPIMVDDQGQPITEKHGQVKVRLGDREIRFEQDPFPLYPLEVLVSPGVQKREVLAVHTALKLRALRNFEYTDESGKLVAKVAGDLYLFVGPGTYKPRVEEEVLEKISASVVTAGEALRLRATTDFTDRTDTLRKAGEEWLHKDAGSFLPAIEEEIVARVQPIVLTDKQAIHVEALRDFTDVFDHKRLAGEQWLVTNAQAPTYLPTPDEKIVRNQQITVLNKNQYCVVVNVCDGDGKVQLGMREVRVGQVAFFLQPGEALEAGIQDVYVLGEGQAVLLQAMETHQDLENGKQVMRKPGNKWMVYGPTTFVPSVHVAVLEKREAIPLGENEGIYVRNQMTGKVRTVAGRTYMLLPDEELWEKPLPDVVEQKLISQNAAHTEYIEDAKGKKASSKRDKSRVVTYNLPHNAICQVYDYKAQQQRIVFGPERVALGPDEAFTVVSLSGSEWVPNKPTEVMPKVEGLIKTVFLYLGPDTLSDVIEVETADHARLRLQLSYSWHFAVKHGDVEAAKKVFNVPDFVADACKRIASRVRGAVAAVPFDTFHRNSAAIIASSVFVDSEGKPQLDKPFFFESNLLTITSIDIQNVECVDAKTRDSLQKSVKLAIEITTASQEADARHLAEEQDQRAKGQLERQLLNDKAAAEREKIVLLELQAESAAIESTGTSKAEAKANSEARLIEGRSAVQQANLKAEAKNIAYDAELVATVAKRTAELDYLREMDQLTIKKEKEMADIATSKFSAAVTAIGTQTIASMARAGPEMQAKLLKGLGLQGYLLTDGSSPINLFNAANSMVGGSA